MLFNVKPLYNSRKGCWKRLEDIDKVDCYTEWQELEDGEKFQISHYEYGELVGDVLMERQVAIDLAKVILETLGEY